MAPALRQQPGAWPTLDWSADMADGICSVITCTSPTRARGLCNRHYLRAWNDGTLDLVASLPSTRDLFWAKVDRSTLNGCWEWQASRDVNGYGRFSSNTMDLPSTLAHRIAYEWTIGRIPEGLVLDHLCRNPPCVNPAHLDPVTLAENTRRGIHPNSTKAACKSGHDFTPENTYVYGDGHRACWTCIRRWRRQATERRRETRQSA